MGDVGVGRRLVAVRAGRAGTATRSLRRDLVVAAVAEVGGLVLLARYAGLGLAGWVAGVIFTVVAGLALTAAFRRAARPAWTPANQVTLIRLTLIGGVTALVVARLGEPAPTVMIVIGAVALILDAVDGRVARRTRTETEFGAAFDQEADAFLILVLSVFVAMSMGPWVLAIGAMRYAYVAASWALPWLRVSVPPKYARKVVAAVQGVTLLVVSAQLLAEPVQVGAVASALILLSWSFGDCVGWQWRHGRVAARR